MADLYNLDAELEQGMMGTDDTHLTNGDDENELNAAVSTDDDNHIATATDPMDHDDDDTAVYDDTSTYQSMSNVPVALREAAMERQRIRRGGGGDKTIDNDDHDDETVGVNKLGKGLWDTNKNDSYLVDSLQQQQQQEKRDYQIQLQKLPYTHLYHAWVQECHAPELLPYPYGTIQQIRKGLTRYENYSCMNVQDELDPGDTHRHRSRRQNTNENLNALMDSLLRIDVERVKFLLSDLLKRRIQKITLHPQHYMKLLEEQQQQQQDEGEEMDEDQEKNHLLMCPAEVCVSWIENATKLSLHTPNNLFFVFTRYL